MHVEHAFIDSEYPNLAGPVYRWQASGHWTADGKTICFIKMGFWGSSRNEVHGYGENSAVELLLNSNS